MKIAVGLIGYQCAENLQATLAPWIELKKDNQIYIKLVHGVFPETAKLGYPLKSTDGTIEKMNQLDVEEVSVCEHPAYEYELRNESFNHDFAKDGADYWWLLDHDEVYTVDEIKHIYEYLENHKEVDWFKINFKNYVIKPNLWVDDFVAPRIWRTKVPHGNGVDVTDIKGFYYDNEIQFADVSQAKDRPNLLIPREIAFIKHNSWIGSPEYLKRKVAFQKIHYGACSYRWNELTDQLDFDYDYYFKMGKSVPMLQSD